MLWGSCPWKSTSSLGTLWPVGYSSCNPAKQIPEQAKILPSELQAYNSSVRLAYLSQNLKLYNLVVAAAKAVVSFCIHSQFLIMSNNSSRAFPLVNLLIVSRSCLLWDFWSISISCALSFCPTSRYQGSSGPPWEPKPVIVRLPVVAWRRLHLLVLLHQAVRSLRLSWCHHVSLTSYSYRSALLTGLSVSCLFQDKLCLLQDKPSHI